MIVFGSRGSDLALTQTRMVADQIKRATGIDYRIEVLVTAGDRIQDRPLSGIGIKGLFTRELEDALRSGAIDAAVHSLKDLPVEDPEGLVLGAIPPRENPADVLVTRREVLDAHRGDAAFAQLRRGACVGTSSPRRRLAAVTAREDLAIEDIRGNVPTRVDKVRRSDYDAVILAKAGLNRLAADLSGLVHEELPLGVFTPAPGQGALAVQCRKDDERVLAALRQVHDDTTARCVDAERAVLLGLGGGCSMPLGVLVEPLPGAEADQRFRLRATLFGGEPNAALVTALLGSDPAAMATRVVDAWRPLIGDPLAGSRIATIRPDGERTGLTAALAIAGARVEVLDWTSTEPIAASREQLAALLQSDALAFTSTRAVRHFTAACARQDLQPFAKLSLAVGERTATELIQLGYRNVRAAAGRGGSGLAELCQQLGIAGGKVVGMPGAEQRHAGFETAARALSLEVLTLPVYRLRMSDVATPAPDEVDAVLFTSPSAVDAWLRRAPGRTDVRAIAIGSTTAQALAQHGFVGVTTLADPAPAQLVAAVVAAAGSR